MNARNQTTIKLVLGIRYRETEREQRSMNLNTDLTSWLLHVHVQTGVLKN